MRRLWRELKARWFPMAFARWVNRERCYVGIHNDPSGEWTVTIGSGFSATDKSLGRAMKFAIMCAQSEPGFQWTTDYLKTL